MRRLLKDIAERRGARRHDDACRSGRHRQAEGKPIWRGAGLSRPLSSHPRPLSGFHLPGGVSGSMSVGSKRTRCGVWSGSGTESPTGAPSCRDDGAVEDLGGRTHLHDSAQIHDGLSGRRCARQAERSWAMKIGELELLLEVHQEIDDLRLD